MSYDEPVEEPFQYATVSASARDGFELTQGVLLPDGLTMHPGLAISAAAVLAACDDAASGDWLDAVPMPGGRVGLVVGDVAGRGLNALAAMSQLRSVLGFQLTEGTAPGTALARLGRYADGLGPSAVGVRVCVVVLDPGAGRLRYATAGHLAPAVLRASGSLAALPPTGDGCLGLATEFVEREEAFSPGDLALLASGVGAVDTGRAAARAVAPDRVDEICRAVLEQRVADAADDDSVVVAALCRREPLPVYETCLPAIPDTVAAARHGLSEWLAATGMDAVDVSSLLQAAVELVTNAVEHAYPAGIDHRRTEVRVRCSLDDDGWVRLRVADRGRWAADGDPEPATGAPEVARGRGLFLARAFVDRLRLDADDTGTVVTVEHRPIRRPLLLGVATEPRQGAASIRGGFRTEVADGVMTVTGVVDASVTDDFRLLVGRASRGGMSPLVVDLSRVTALASGAVGALVELGAGVREGALQLVAAPGTTARTVLALAGLPVR